MLFTNTKTVTSAHIFGRSGKRLIIAVLFGLSFASCGGSSSPGATKCVDYLGLSEDARQDAVSDTAQRLDIEILSPGVGGKGAPQLYEARVAVDARCDATRTLRLDEVVASANLGAPGTATSQTAADSAPAASTPPEQGDSSSTSGDEEAIRQVASAWFRAADVRDFERVCSLFTNQTAREEVERDGGADCVSVFEARPRSDLNRTELPTTLRLIAEGRIEYPLRVVDGSGGESTHMGHVILVVDGNSIDSIVDVDGDLELMTLIREDEGWRVAAVFGMTQ